MSEHYVSPIAGPADQGFQGSLRPTERYARTEAAERSSARGDPSESIRTQSQPQEHSITDPTNVHLQFKIDPETNDITVIVMDRESEQVIRTIPPEELSDLVEGDLLEVLT